jgi:hypothetical protein
MQEILGNSLLPYLILLLLFVPLAWATGQGVASRWERPRLVLLYCAMLTVAERFFDYALAKGHAFSVAGGLVVLAVLCAAGVLAWRLSLVAMMVRQYPWLYERDGLLGWRERSGAS